ncbi:hypothetical protein [Streptomyces beihaiensis]|uniref:Uncharacterized protein n=1 Tax=Streptomyces beihaiensis TaxID=2984495 RepID=A0ABT3TU41_9ACTN|nr:hypothetical protein [Streptomyces beihaiensis]MCX3060549.1 hypothetical protein [Streptomyces beihaiensis]
MADEGVDGTARTERLVVVHDPGGPRNVRLRMAVGQEVAVTLHGTPGYGWTPVEVVDGPLAVIAGEVCEGVARAVVRAVGPGRGEVRSTSSFRGDGFGPQTRLWRLAVSVEA